MAKNTSSAERQLLLQMVEEAHRLPNWNATNLRSALRRVTPEMAIWRPPHVNHTIAEIVVHCAYWKYALWRQLTGAQRGSFPFKGSNWFKTKEKLSRGEWAELLQLLDDQHQQMCAAIAETRNTISDAKPRAGQWSTLQRTYWLAIHDGYHTGQINMIKAMHRRANNR